MWYDLQITDLGLTLDQSLTFHLQIDNIVSKANKLLGFIYRQIHVCYDLFCLKSLYVCLVRSSIEYCSIMLHFCLFLLYSFTYNTEATLP